ncbi:hypothetical protein DUNSADRAFT_14950 [Dunaliella salina]|uniref:F-box domain-containing protein n=1 Tax=Dunaliella salina TaxID=3046 RepID=A0ABQ7G6C6_DUNSA|nr:hypothetical protein DUNSADRAFT_14950 [Dunaliella salina]|eukprot:KAF5830152.1 hypothetical protein DUNSADRAFT_14950 [Dunaliella salina]
MAFEGAPHYLRYLPDRDIAQIIASLDSLSRAALRASCKANKAVVDAHVQEARYYGVARNSRHEASLPPYIRRVQIFALGPPTQEWLCRSLAGLQHLTHLHITAERAREDELLRHVWSCSSVYAHVHKHLLVLVCMYTAGVLLQECKH